MRQAIFTISMLCASVLSAQQTVTYTIEMTARPDSSFLVETISVPIQGSPRNQETVTYRIFRDTAELTDLCKQLEAGAAEAQQRAQEQATRAALLRNQAAAIRQAQGAAFGQPEVKAGSPPAWPSEPKTKPQTPSKKPKKKKT